MTKLWNATKFAAIHLEKLEAEPSTAFASSNQINETLDRWILTRLHKAIAKATAAYDKFEYADALRATEDFFWNDFCDNYLELVKKRAYDEEGENPAGQQSAVVTIYHCLEGILKLFAPVVPHITEELYAHLFPAEYDKAGSLHARGTWPNASDYPVDETAEASGIAGVAVLEAVRKAKSEASVSIKYPVTQMVIHSEQLKWETLEPVAEDVKAAGSVEALVWNAEAMADASTSEDGTFTYRIVLAEQADVA
ncbi:MAG: class I tRNA ligase family protein [Rickettsiales bacterium]|nr:class I tRNA ligase family protein [Rickettsiales bacterium]